MLTPNQKPFVMMILSQESTAFNEEFRHLFPTQRTKGSFALFRMTAPPGNIRGKDCLFPARVLRYRKEQDAGGGNAMKSIGKNLAEAVAFSIVMVIIAWFDGSIVLEGAVKPLWFQVTTRFLIYTAIFFVVSLIVDAVFARVWKK